MVSAHEKADLLQPIYEGVIDVPSLQYVMQSAWLGVYHILRLACTFIANDAACFAQQQSLTSSIWGFFREPHHMSHYDSYLEIGFVIAALAATRASNWIRKSEVTSDSPVGYHSDFHSGTQCAMLAIMCRLSRCI